MTTEQIWVITEVLPVGLFLIAVVVYTWIKEKDKDD